MNHAHRATRKFLRNERGFTLIELLITMMIIAILASVVLFALYRAGNGQDAKDPGPDRQARRDHQGQVGKLQNAPRAGDDPGRDAIPSRGQDAARRAARPDADGAARSLDGHRPGTIRGARRRCRSIRRAWPAASQGYAAASTARVQLTGPNPPPALHRSDYQRRRMLYMIVTGAWPTGGDSPDVFKADNIGDVDHDGVPGVHRRLGQPDRLHSLAGRVGLRPQSSCAKVRVAPDHRAIHTARCRSSSSTSTASVQLECEVLRDDRALCRTTIIAGSSQRVNNLLLQTSVRPPGSPVIRYDAG